MPYMDCIATNVLQVFYVGMKVVGGPLFVGFVGASQIYAAALYGVTSCQVLYNMVIQIMWCDIKP